MSRSGNLLITNDHLIYQLLEDPKYDVREDGTIWTTVTLTGKTSKTGQWREAGTVKGFHGYRVVKFNNRNLAAHRIIYAKYGPLPLSLDLVVNHIDSNKANNHPSNLELVTQSHNCFHAFKQGRAAPKSRAKITQEIAETIRVLSLEGVNNTKLAEQFKIDRSTIRDILQRRTWK